MSSTPRNAKTHRHDLLQPISLDAVTAALKRKRARLEPSALSRLVRSGRRLPPPARALLTIAAAVAFATLAALVFVHALATEATAAVLIPLYAFHTWCRFDATCAERRGRCRNSCEAETGCQGQCCEDALHGYVSSEVQLLQNTRHSSGVHRDASCSDKLMRMGRIGSGTSVLVDGLAPTHVCNFQQRNPYGAGTGRPVSLSKILNSSETQWRFGSKPFATPSV